MGSVNKDSCGGIYPSNLHLKKELTQIRKAARVLRDPGTSCNSLMQTPFSSRTVSRPRLKSGYDDCGGSYGSRITEQVDNNDDTVVGEKGNLNVMEKDKRIFLCNWDRDLRCKQNGKEHDGEINKGQELFSAPDEEMDADILSDARFGGGNDCKSDAWFSERYASMILKCREASFTPSVRRTIKKKPRRSFSGVRVKNQNLKSGKQNVYLRYGKHNADGVSGVGLPGDDFVNLVCQMGESEEDCDNFEDVKRESASSPFLAGFKNAGWKHSSVKLIKGRGKDDDSASLSTPALSTSSYHKNAVPNPSIELWDTGTASLNDADDEVDDQWDFPGRQGCGISCCWSKRSTPKSRTGYGSCCSPSLSDILKRKGSSIICLKQHNCSSLSSANRRLNSRGLVQSLVPLLSNGDNRHRVASSDSGSSDNESLMSLGELHLEAMSQLDGRRLPSACGNRQGSEPLALCDQPDDENDEGTRTLSHKYRPILFDELVGQNIVVHSLRTAISRRRIAPVYLFHGPRGTGKSSTARIFAAALNCLAIEEAKPCGVCKACNNFISGKSSCLLEVDGCNRKEISCMKNHLKSLLSTHPSALKDFKVFVIEECHLLPSKAWLSFLRLLEKPLPHIVFIFVTTDAESIPHTILSRCQRHLFSRIATGEVIARLMKISTSENLDIEPDALELIASNADGSLRDAETMLDQLSLLGKRITISLVNDLMGGVSDEKLLELLELAMSSNTTETVIRARELLDLGVDPIVLMSQMATLIVDMIAGTHAGVGGKFDSFSNRRSLTEREVARLKQALAVLCDAEKHLRASAERSTWFKATLLHLGSLSASDQSHSGSSRRPSSKVIREDQSCTLGQVTPLSRKSDAHLITGNSASPQPASAPRDFAGKDGSTKATDSVEETTAPADGRLAFKCMDSKMLNNIWNCCIEKCRSNTLRQLLYANGRLVSISDIKGGLLVHIAFSDRNIRTRAEGFISSITNSLEAVLQQHVEVKIILLPESLVLEPSRASGGRCFNPVENRGPLSGDSRTATPQNSKPSLPDERIESIIHDQRMEMQATGKSTPARVRPERNQVLPQDNEHPSTNGADSVSSDAPLPKWEDELNQEIKAMMNQKEQKLHRSKCRPLNSGFMSSLSLDSMEYESGSAKAPGCGRLFCWNRRRAHPRVKGEKSKCSQISCFGECGKAGRATKHSR